MRLQAGWQQQAWRRVCPLSLWQQQRWTRPTLCAPSASAGRVCAATSAAARPISAARRSRLAGCCCSAAARTTTAARREGREDPRNAWRGALSCVAAMQAIVGCLLGAAAVGCRRWWVQRLAPRLCAIGRQQGAWRAMRVVGLTPCTYLCRRQDGGAARMGPAKLALLASPPWAAEGEGCLFCMAWTL